MPLKKKKNTDEKMEQDDPQSSGSDGEETDSDDGPHPDAYSGNEEIQVDFEGRNPIDSDFHGIRQLMQQLFLKASINLSELADIIIGQNYIGSVVTQCENDEDEDDDEDDDMSDSNMIFGITSAINLSNKPDVGCIQQLRSYIIEKADKNATDSCLKLFRDVLGNDSKPVGFLLNERFVNIPPQISVPLLENLGKEVQRANNKKMPYNFVYYLMLVKFYRKAAKKNKPAEDIYSNAEEEVMCEEAVASFEYSVENETESGVSGDWLEDDSNLKPFRKFILFDAVKLPQMIDSIKKLIEQ